MRSVTIAICLASVMAGAAFSDTLADTADTENGTLNPEELTLDRVMKDVAEGRTSMTICSTGYYITKAGRHEIARRLFEQCAADGWTGAMTWMSQLDDNGLEGQKTRTQPPNGTAGRQRLATRSEKFNYGLDLMRGRGVVENRTLGRLAVDEAAREGLPTARRLQGAGYDLDEVTPDADNHKYAPSF